jgi:hypothetical protein
VLYAGDLLFIGGTPISWAGPVIAASGIHQVRDYPSDLLST